MGRQEDFIKVPQPKLDLSNLNVNGSEVTQGRDLLDPHTRLPTEPKWLRNIDARASGYPAVENA
jgi:hypothetical protein